jgi:hypothetical protein
MIGEICHYMAQKITVLEALWQKYGKNQSTKNPDKSRLETHVSEIKPVAFV